MPQPRHALVDPAATPYYHCITRCVRRAFLCGQDAYSGRNFDHRKTWVVDKLAELARIFCIDVCAYAVMSNHLHVVLRIAPERAQGLSEDQLQRRHARLFPLMTARMAGLSASQIKDRLETFRARLADLSWFMRCLSESIARRANKEDGCKGRFWEGRFKSQALLDEAALLTCMSYVDLNPVRAGLAESLEASDFTSIQQRLRAVAARSGAAGGSLKETPRRQTQASIDAKTRGARRVQVKLMDFARSWGRGAERGRSERLPLCFADYLALLQWAGQQLRKDKRGALPPASRELLERLGLDPERWLEGVSRFHRCFFTAAGSEARIREHGRRRGLLCMRGAILAREVYTGAA